MIMPTVAIQIIAALVIASGIMCVLWLIQRKTHNAGIVDAGWAASVGVLAVAFAITSSGYVPRRICVAVCVGLWALRLSTYLMRDRVLGKPEDGRYASLRDKWGDRAEREFFKFFQYQAVFAVFFALPALVVSHNPVRSWTAFDTCGALLWLFGAGNAMLADWQLAQFRAQPSNRGRTCRKGWWRYSRHPNYFFEWLHWWAYVALAAGSPYWWINLSAPAVMLYLLLRVTGIPPTEAQALARRGDDYREYQRTTNAFIPWFPKKKALDP